MNASRSSFEPGRLIESQLAALKQADAFTESERTARSSLLAAQAARQDEAAALKALIAKLNSLRRHAQAIQGGAGFLGFTFLSSDATAVTGNAAAGTRVGAYEVAIKQLADTTTGRPAIFTVNGEEFTSDSNTIADAGGIAGLTLNLLEVTSATAPPPPPLLDVQSFNASNEHLRLAETSGLQTGDLVQFSGDLRQIAGIDDTSSYFIKVEGADIVLFKTLADLQLNNPVDIGNGNRRGFQSVSGITVQEQLPSAPQDAVMVTVGRSKEEAVAEVKQFFETLADVFNFIDVASTDGEALHRDETSAEIARKLRSAVGSALSTLGDAVQTNSANNQVTLDTGRLNSLLDANFDTVEAVFRNGNGIANRIEQALGQVSELTGPIGARLRSIRVQQTDTEQELSDLVKRSEERREELLSAFASIASTLIASNRQSHFVSRLAQDVQSHKAGINRIHANPATVTAKSVRTH